MKYIPWVIIIILLGGLAFYFWKENRATSLLLAIKNDKLMQSNLELGRAHTQIVNQEKAHKAALAEVTALWKDEIKKRKAAVSLYAQLEAKYKAEKKKVKTLTKIVYKDREIPIEQGKIFYLNEENEYIPVTSMTYAYKDFRITIEGDAVKQVLNYSLHQRFKAQFVETRLPSGAKNHYARVFEIDENNKEVGELELTTFEVLRAEDLPDRFMWWNPKLDLMVGGGLNSKLGGTWTGEVGFSAMAYGQTPDDIKWRFLRVGTGITNHGYSLTFSPAQLNIGEYLPVISNTWLTPYGGYDFGAGVPHAGLGVSVVF